MWLKKLLKPALKNPQKKHKTLPDINLAFFQSLLLLWVASTAAAIFRLLPGSLFLTPFLLCTLPFCTLVLKCMPRANIHSSNGVENLVPSSEWSTFQQLSFKEKKAALWWCCLCNFLRCLREKNYSTCQTWLIENKYDFCFVFFLFFCHISTVVPSCSPDLYPYYFIMFPKMEIKLKGNGFKTVEGHTSRMFTERSRNGSCTKSKSQQEDCLDGGIRQI